METGLSTDGGSSSKAKNEDVAKPTTAKCLRCVFAPPVKGEDDDHSWYGMPKYEPNEGDQKGKKHHQLTSGRSRKTNDAAPHPPGECNQPACTGQLKNECCRRETFRNWPFQSRVDFKKLAEAGFIYSGRGDEVMCVFCDIRISGWKAGDDLVMEKHRQLNSKCEFVLGRSDNVPIHRCPQLTGTEVKGLSRPLDVGVPIKKQDLLCQEESTQKSEEGSQEIHEENNVYGQEEQQTPYHTLLASFDDVKNGVDVYTDSAYPGYATETSRLDTFHSWPANAPVGKEALARAGLFYMGIGDYTTCFFCGKGLSKWQDGDDPWTEHTRWYPKCGFVRINEGFTTAKC